MLQLDLERRNFQLRYEQLAGEKADLKTEVIRLREKVELLSVEKTLLEQQAVETVGRKEEEEEREEQERRDREEELVMTVMRLSQRVGDQDQELAEIKGDISRPVSHWSSSYITVLSLVERFIVMKCHKEAA